MTKTPHSQALLAEASGFAQRLGAPLTIIHTGTSEAESLAYLAQTARQLGIAHGRHIVWNQREPAQALLRAAEDAGIELLVAGAFEGPAVNRRRFLGGVARQLAENARCSLLLVAHPRVDTYDFQRIVVITDFSDVSKIAVESALWLAHKDSAECIYVVSIHTIFMEARAEIGTKDSKPARTRQQEENLMESLLASIPQCGVPIIPKVVDATTGFAACEFAEAVDADLLVLPGHNRPCGRVPPMTDWALQVVPCSLWIVHGGPVWSGGQLSQVFGASSNASEMVES